MYCFCLDYCSCQHMLSLSSEQFCRGTIVLQRAAVGRRKRGPHALAEAGSTWARPLAKKLGISQARGNLTGAVCAPAPALSYARACFLRLLSRNPAPHRRCSVNPACNRHVLYGVLHGAWQDC